MLENESLSAKGLELLAAGAWIPLDQPDLWLERGDRQVMKDEEQKQLLDDYIAERESLEQRVIWLTEQIRLLMEQRNSEFRK